jgi:16S rRNA (guanine527-N7)-methyltransferase
MQAGEVSRFTVSAQVDARLAQLRARYGLPLGSERRLAALLDRVAAEPTAITAVRDPVAGVDFHVADSLVALDLPAVRQARRIADLGSGGGFPGLALAIALPAAHVALVESVGRKCAFLAAAAAAAEVANVDVVNARAEEWQEGVGENDLIAARALAPLPVVMEYAAPLLAPGGALVAWKGRLEPGEEADGAAAAVALGLSRPKAIAVQPFSGARDRYLYLSSKVRPTPEKFPRRAGMARKRPIRAPG